MKKKTKLIVFTMFVISILMGSALQLYFVYGATQSININVSGTNTGGVYDASMTGDFLGDTINYATFHFNWGADDGEILIHTARGLMTIKLSLAEYDAVSQQFKIKKAVITYPSGYPYTITIDMIIGTADSSSFNGYIVGRYTEVGSSGGGSSTTCEDCCAVTYTNDSDGQVIHVEARGDKDISNAGVLFYATGGGSQSVNMNRVSDRLYFVDFTYGGTPVRSFTASITFKDGTSTTEYYTVSSSSSSSTWGNTSSGGTSSDYTTALNLAKSKNFSTVMALINDLNASAKNRQASITLLQDQLRVKSTEYESLKTTSDQYLRDATSWRSQYEQQVQRYNELNTKYTALLGSPQQSETPTNIIPKDLKIPKEVLVLVVIGIVLLVLWKKKKLPSIRKKKFDPHEYQEQIKKNGNGLGIPKGTNTKEEPEYIVRDIDDDGRTAPTTEQIRERLATLEKEYKELERQNGGKVN